MSRGTVDNPAVGNWCHGDGVCGPSLRSTIWAVDRGRAVGCGSGSARGYPALLTDLWVAGNRGRRRARGLTPAVVGCAVRFRLRNPPARGSTPAPFHQGVWWPGRSTRWCGSLAAPGPGPWSVQTDRTVRVHCRPLPAGARQDPRPPAAHILSNCTASGPTTARSTPLAEHPRPACLGTAREGGRRLAAGEICWSVQVGGAPHSGPAEPGTDPQMRQEGRMSAWVLGSLFVCQGISLRTRWVCTG